VALPSGDHQYPVPLGYARGYAFPGGMRCWRVTTTEIKRIIMRVSQLVQRSIKETPNVMWPVRVIGLLLFLQAFLISGVTIYFVQQIDWERELEDIMLSLSALDMVMWAATLAPIILLLLVTSMAFLAYRRFAWLLAMTLQGLILLRCLILYFASNSAIRNSPWVHLIMLYSLILVLYLNTTDIRLAFTTEHRHESK